MTDTSAARVLRAIGEAYATVEGPVAAADIYERAGVSSATFYRLRKNDHQVATALATASGLAEVAKHRAPDRVIQELRSTIDELTNVIANLAVIIEQRDRAIADLRSRTSNRPIPLHISDHA